jgi:hypothetical protein
MKRDRAGAIVSVAAVLTCAAVFAYFLLTRNFAGPQPKVIQAPAEIQITTSPPVQALGTRSLATAPDRQAARWIDMRVVSDSSGDPLPGASICEVPVGLLAKASQIRVLAEAGLDGLCRIEARDSETGVAVRKPGYQPKLVDSAALASAIASNAPCVVRLSMGNRLTVRCVYMDGAPAVGCRVVASRVWGPAGQFGGDEDLRDLVGLDSCRAPQIGFTNESGSVELGELDDQPYYVQVHKVGYCTEHAGKLQANLATPPGVLEFRLSPVWVARAAIPPEWGDCLWSITRRAPGTDSTGAMSRDALRWRPELARELWNVRRQVGETEGQFTESVRIVSELGHVVEAAVNYVPILDSRPEVISIAAQRLPVYDVSILVVDARERAIGARIQLTLQKDGSPFSVPVSRKLELKRACKLVAGRYVARVYDIGREWFETCEFRVPLDAPVVLRSREVLEDCQIGLDVPHGYIPSRWQFSAAIRGYREIHRQMSEEDSLCHLWLPRGEGFIRVTAPELAEIAVPVVVGAGIHNVFSVKMLWQ